AIAAVIAADWANANQLPAGTAAPNNTDYRNAASDPAATPTFVNPTKPSRNTTNMLFLLNHAEFMHELPDAYLADVLPIAKKIAVALAGAPYNILQVPHVHFHVIPKTESEGLGVGWKSQATDHAKFAALAAELRDKIAAAGAAAGAAPTL
ncbi:Adenosine 5'-monophosphoramidase, partial [Cladochytrium tenue]